MPDFMLIGLFLFLVLAPCLVAFLDGDSDRLFPDEWYLDKRHRRSGVDEFTDLVHELQPEVSLSKDFLIRSFPKGLSQRRLVIRDTDSGVKLTIWQVRAAAIELMKLSGSVAARELANIAALSAMAMASVKNAVELAAREALEAARNAYAWFAWGDSMSEDNTLCWLADLTPPELKLELPPELKIELPPEQKRDSGGWRNASQAA